MSSLRVFLFSCLLTLTMTGSALAEGFAMSEWSARGLGLAGGMVGRADDPSALAYNAAGITQLPGTQIMGGASFVAPYGTIEGVNGGKPFSTSVKPAVWMPPHGYITHQLNDNVWLGFGMFSRFGLGNSFEGSWAGRSNVYDVGLQTVSAVPTVAYKINDMFSVSAGLEMMYLHMYEGVRIPTTQDGRNVYDNDMQLEGQSIGFGGHFGLHAKFNEYLSAGLNYKTQVTQNVHGDADFSQQFGKNQNILSATGRVPTALNSGISGTLQLPDSLSFGLAYKPLPNLSFEVGTIWTRWSTYNHLNIYFDEPSSYRSLSEKNWKDGWNFNASVEYAPLDWLTLRAGYWHETSVIDENHADFMMPTNGRDVMSLGLGLNWENWKLDLAYAHIWIYPTNYSYTNASGISGSVGNGKSTNTGADIYSFSISYTF